MPEQMSDAEVSMLLMKLAGRIDDEKERLAFVKQSPDEFRQEYPEGKLKESPEQKEVMDKLTALVEDPAPLVEAMLALPVFKGYDPALLYDVLSMFDLLSPARREAYGSLKGKTLAQAANSIASALVRDESFMMELAKAHDLAERSGTDEAEKQGNEEEA